MGSGSLNLPTVSFFLPEGIHTTEMEGNHKMENDDD